MPNKLTALVSILALGPALAVVSIPAGAAAAASTASGATGTTIARGSLESAGRPMAGVRAVLYAWPKNSVLAGQRPGQRVPVTVVGAATTNSSGRYAISAAPASLQAAAAPDGTVNLEVVALSPGKFASYSFSRTLGQMARGAIRLPAASAVAAARVRPKSVAAFAQMARTAARTAAGTAGPAGQVPCGWVNLTTYAPAWTTVGATFDTTTDVTQHFSYSYGEESLMGVGVSGTGKYGSFSQSGGSTVSSTATEDFPSSTGAIDTRYYTQFRSTEYGYTCAGNGFYSSYQTRPTSFAGGAKSVGTGYPVANYCVYQEQGSTFTEDNSASYTFGAGFYLPVIGINLTAQTGYNSGASLSYHFGIAHYLCGTADYPGGTPRELVAGRV